MSPFEKFGITHLSPSSLNLYAANPALWVGRYLLGWQDEAGVAAHRGSAVEAGLDLWLYHRNEENAVEKALATFAERTQGEASEEHEAERGFIAPMLHEAVSALANAPVPLARQVRVDYHVAGIDVPIIGYIDYLFDGYLLDLKTTKACPSSIRPDHARQVALYAWAKKRPAKVLYVTPKKSAVYDLTDNEAAMHLADLELTARSIQHLLAKSANAKDAARFFAVSRDDYRWTEPLLEQAEKIWRAA